MPTPVPELDLPAASGGHVSVSILNGLNSWLPAEIIVQPPIRGHDTLRMVSYSFLITNAAKREKVVFDLAIMKDHNNKMAPALQKLFEGGPGEVKVDKDIPEQLTEQGLDLSEINAVIWSHSHIDHVGDPSLFPSSVDLIVGPGFRQNHMPGYPANPSAFMLDSAFTGRSIRELDFSDSDLVIGGFRAIDYWQDGSFYLLESLGHSSDHLCGLARTETGSWVLMAGDTCHHVGQLRPSIYRPLPDTLSPSPLQPLPRPDEDSTYCSSAPFKTLLEERKESTFYGMCEHLQDDLQQAEKSRRKLQAFDGSNDVLVVLAHDRTLLNVVDFWPGILDEWKDKGWSELGRWRFLEHFKNAVEDGVK